MAVMIALSGPTTIMAYTPLIDRRDCTTRHNDGQVQTRRIFGIAPKQAGRRLI